MVDRRSPTAARPCFRQQRRILGRVRIDTAEAVDEWQPPRKVIDIIKELQREGRL